MTILVDETRKTCSFQTYKTSEVLIAFVSFGRFRLYRWSCAKYARCINNLYMRTEHDTSENVTIKKKGNFMANIKSQKKRIITNEKARLRNRAIKSELKTAVRRVREAVSANDAENAYASALRACKLLDKAASKGVIHKNQAANRKSGIMHLANSIVTDEVRNAYVAEPKKEQAATGNKKAAAKAKRQKELKAASAEKAKRREAQKKTEAKAAKKKAEAAKKAEAEAAAAAKAEEENQAEQASEATAE